MKNVLLISNKVYHYRIPIYNYFYNEFKKIGIEFSLLTYELQSENLHEIEFDYAVIKASGSKYIQHIKKVKPDAVIFFMHLKDWVMWPLLPFLKMNNIPFIRWGHGVNLMDPDNKFKKVLFDLIHRLSSAIILYSPREKKYIKAKQHHKIFVANNTLNFHSFPKIEKSKEEIKKEFGISYEIVVLFVGRITKDKKLDVLLEIFKSFPDSNVGLVIVGPDISEEQVSVVSTNKNITYLGPLYDEIKVNSIFKMADIFCIPGKNGLGLNQAMYWGLPVVTMEGTHAPEIIYLKNGYNGYLTERNSVSGLGQTIKMLANDKELISRLSKNAEATMLQEGNINNMFSAFREAINYALSKSKTV